MPFTYFISYIPPDSSSSTLHKIYLVLLQKTKQSWIDYASQHNIDHNEFSYNMGMTPHAMIMCPRISEGVILHSEDGNEVGFVAMNGSLLAGGVMVKQKEEWEYLR